MAEIAYSYSEVDNPLPRKRERLDAEEEDGQTYEQRVEEFKNLTPRERKVAELRKKLKQSRCPPPSIIHLFPSLLFL